MSHISILATLILLLITINDGAIISQSAIKDCSWGDSSEPSSPGGEVCKKKMLVSMVLGSAQGNTEALYANVDKAHEQGNDKMSVLKKPFRIELRKTAVVASYRALKLGSANALPKETKITKKDCNDDFYSQAKRLPCGMQYTKSGKRVWDSQGFCCNCDSVNKRYNRRGSQDCGLAFFQGKGSAHCMKMDDLWYDVFELEMPMMQYRITLDVLVLQGINNVNGNGTKTVNWTLVSTFHLSPSRTIGRSKNGRVVAEVQGSLLGSKAIKDLSAKRLLIPSVRMWPKKKPYPPQYTNGPNDWMLVDSDRVSLYGKECNKVGVGYVGFRRQPGRCQLREGSCFHGQPLQLWNSDDKRRKKKIRGRYMIHNFGKVHHGSHPNKDSFILQFLHDDLHNSFVTLRIDASDIAFVKSVSSGRIVETYTEGFMASTTHGSLTVEIANTGEISSEYTVSVSECSNEIFEIPDKKLTLEPAEVKNVTFSLRSSGRKGGHKDCEVKLLDSTLTLLQTAKVSFKVDAACLCYGSCGCECDDEMKGVKCNKKAVGPSVFYKPGPIFAIVLVMVLESIGAHGFIAFFGGLLLILGFIKLSCGGIMCCRKTKQQEYTERMIKKGVPPKSPLLVQCSGECRGAQAAKARYMRKVQRLKQAGKSPHRLDDWRNTSFECQCKSELTDIRFVHVVRAVCFFYFCCFLPFIWIGRCVVWRIFKDTEEKKAKAEQEVLLRAKKKGNMEKYGVIDLATELKKMEEGSEVKSSETKDDDQSAAKQELIMNIDYSAMDKSKNTENAKTNTTKDKEKQTVVGGALEHKIQDQSISPQLNLRKEKGNEDRETTTFNREMEKPLQGRVGEGKRERKGVNRQKMTSPKQKIGASGLEYQTRNVNPQSNLRAEKGMFHKQDDAVPKLQRKEIHVASKREVERGNKAQRKETVSKRDVDRGKEQKGHRRGHKSNSKGRSMKYHGHKSSLKSHPYKSDNHSRSAKKASISHSAKKDAHQLSSQTSYKSKDSDHTHNSEEEKSCRESLDKESDHSLSHHSGHSESHRSASHASSQHCADSQLSHKSSISEHSGSHNSCESHSSNGDERHDEGSHSNSDDESGCSNEGSHSDSGDEGSHSDSGDEGSHSDSGDEGSHSDSGDEGSHSESGDEGSCSDEGSHNESGDEGSCSDEGSHSESGDEGSHSSGDEGNHSESEPENNSNN